MVALAFAVTAFLVLLAPSLLRSPDEWLRDRMVAAAATSQHESRILVIDIDEASLGKFAWPWPRKRLSDLVEMVLMSGARGVALDILLDKEGDLDGDQRMAMLAEHGPVVLPQLFDFQLHQIPLQVGALGGGTPGRLPGAPEAAGYIANHMRFAHASHFGNIGVALDADGVLRRLPMHVVYGNRTYPALAMALYNCCSGLPPVAMGAGTIRIPYRRDLEAFDVASASDVLDGTVTPEHLAGRLVFIGSSALSLGDRVATPLNELTPGVLVHATILSELLDREAGLAPAPWPGRWITTLFAAALAALALYTLPRLSAAFNSAMLACAVCVWLPLAAIIAPHDPDFSPSVPLLLIGLLLGVAVPVHWQLSQRRTGRLLGTLRQYVASAVVDELLRSDLKDPLAPRPVDVTTLVADMEGYTSHVEALPLDEAAKLTSDFLECLTGPVLATRGTLDKYTGDGLMAFWGAPLPDPEHADHALDAARRILVLVAELSAARCARGERPLRVRIGIESGAAMAGDYGSSMRSIYTAVGDSVNTAARLEQAARDYACSVVIGEGTAALARRHGLRPLDQRQLRGKARPVQLYTLADAGSAT